MRTQRVVLNRRKKKSKKIRQITPPPQRKKKKRFNRRFWFWFLFSVLVILALVYYLYARYTQAEFYDPFKGLQTLVPKKVFVPKTGKILTTEAPQTFTPAQTLGIIKQTSPAFDLPVTNSITKQTFSYTSSDGKTDDVPIYARVYLPAGAAAGSLPVYSFAPGTTGMGDQCAASVEDPSKRNWANYDSLMMSYASQGYAVVIMDYEGMRDTTRIHHYMVGELEGKAVLDSVRALYNLDTTKSVVNKDQVFMGGYSQGGHAVFWADQLAKNYAPDLDPNGVIGYGPVTDVEETLADITNGANINWFGPFVLVAYQDWYNQTFPINSILQPKWRTNLRVDVLRECIDTVNNYWPHNLGVSRVNQVYTPEFIQALRNGLASNPLYKTLADDMAINIVGNIKTERSKLINQGQHDVVILPRQSEKARLRYCTSGNHMTYRSYDRSRYTGNGPVDHYNTMTASFRDTLEWMNTIRSGGQVPNSC